jgi:hypothetical protein
MRTYKFKQDQDDMIIQENNQDPTKHNRIAAGLHRTKRTDRITNTQKDRWDFLGPL